MVIFEIVTPGTCLDSDDRDWSWRIERHLRSLMSQFFDANAALNLFFSATLSCDPPLKKGSQTKSETQADFELFSRVQSAILAKNGDVPDATLDWEDVQYQITVGMKRERWREGRVPVEFERRLPFIYARAFLHALDAFEKLLEVLAKEAGVPPAISDLHAQLGLAFPDLRGVRNTTQHLEDRARGLGAGRERKPLQLQPIVNNFVYAPAGGVLVLDCLNGTRYSCTMADGRLGEVDVSEESMRRLQTILESILHTFKWRGAKQHSPSA